MLRRLNWRIVLGVVFTVTGVAFLTQSRWLEAGDSLLLGLGLFGAVYADRHPERARGVLAWTVVIVWGIALAVVTILKLRQ